MNITIPVKLAKGIWGYLDQERPIDVWQKWGVVSLQNYKGTRDTSAFDLEYNDPTMSLVIFVNIR